MEGRGDLALETARAAAEQSKGDHVYGEYVRSLPSLTLLYLQRWDALKAEAMPKGEQGMAAVLGEMTHGIALARTGKIELAKAALARIEPVADALLKKNTGSDYVGKLVRSLVGTAQHQLRAEVALAEKRTDDAIALQMKAVIAANDADNTEPPTLAGNSRVRLGMMQVQAKRYTDAEQSFREDLKVHLHSGWSLQGLTTALNAQGKNVEAQALKDDLDKSWKLADAQLRLNN
jgi:hypothetical protein